MAIIKLLSPNVLYSPTCLKPQLSNVIFSDLSQRGGKSVDLFRGMYKAQAIVNSVYHSKNAIGAAESQLIPDFKHDFGHPSTSFASPQSV